MPTTTQPTTSFNPVSSHKLGRLDVPGKKGLWRWLQKISSVDERRDEFRRLIANDRHDDPDTIPKLRTLVDLGLWDEFMVVRIDTGKPKPWIGVRRSRSFWSLFERTSLTDVLRSPKHEATVMFSPLDWREDKPVPVEIVHLMIEAGLDPDARVEESPDMHRLLAHLADAGDLEQAMLVFKAGADPNLQEWPNSTVAHILVNNGSKQHIEFLRHMVDMGLDINHVGQDTKKKTIGPAVPPAAMAIYNDDLEVMQALVDMGAKMDWGGRTAFHIFASDDKEHPTSHIYAVMNALMGWGAKLDEPFNAGITPLWASVPHSPDKAIWLIERGVKLEIDTMHNGAVKRQTMLEHLIQMGADADKWSYVVEQIERLQPDCWTRKCSDLVEGCETVVELAMQRGDGWAARASAHLMREQVGPVNVEQSGPARPGPRF